MTAEEQNCRRFSLPSFDIIPHALTPSRPHGLIHGLIHGRGPLKVGEHTLELFLMCDSYVGCDQEYAVELMVGAPGSDDESDED